MLNEKSQAELCSDLKIEQNIQKPFCETLDATSWYDFCILSASKRIQREAQKQYGLLTKNTTGIQIVEQNLPDNSTSFTLNCDKWTSRLQKCIVLWDLMICILIHSVAIFISLVALYKHRVGRLYSLILMLTSIIQPITVAFLTAYIISLIAGQIEPERKIVNVDHNGTVFECSIRDYSKQTNNAPVYSLVVALVLNAFMILSSFFTRRNMRFI